MTYFLTMTATNQSACHVLSIKFVTTSELCLSLPTDETDIEVLHRTGHVSHYTSYTSLRVTAALS